MGFIPLIRKTQSTLSVNTDPQVLYTGLCTSPTESICSQSFYQDDELANEQMRMKGHLNTHDQVNFSQIIKKKYIPKKMIPLMK